METQTQYHWPEYLSEAACLGAFMISACVFSVLLEYPASPLHHAIESNLLRHLIGGLAMGCTALAIICSSMGKRSGAHMNPAITMNYWLLGKIRGRDASLYAAAQFAGGITGVWVGDMVLGLPLRHSAVNYVVTQPGPQGIWAALAGEFVISLVLMFTILAVSNSRLSRWTPVFAAGLVALYITFESPLSGMSMNPARTVGSAVAANEWTALWVYLTAPPIAMFVAARLFTGWRGAGSVLCAKLHHHNSMRCIFRCGYAAGQQRSISTSG
jgi:aquaporin Z